MRGIPFFFVRENQCLKMTRSEGDFVSDFSNFPIFAEKGHDLRSKRVLFENRVKPAANKVTKRPPHKVERPIVNSFIRSVCRTGFDGIIVISRSFGN